MQIVRIISISTICIVFLLLLAKNIFKKTDLKFKPFHLTSSLKKHTFYNLLINNILYFCVT